ncbi:MAG: metal-dependent transcriptional regulator [Spirochaeta sp.]|nr:metal-dependent transcriptional regulator [Spirochaeta sp.]
MPIQTLSSSLEDYLEAIYGIVRLKRAARAKDISQRLGVNSSSVTGALHSLSEKGLINYAPYDIVTLTAKGEKIGRDVSHRHTVLQEFFVKVLGVDIESAEENACKMEHEISRDILKRLSLFVEFIESCPGAAAKWIDGIGHFCENPESGEDCERCIAECLEQVQERSRENNNLNKDLSNE